MHVQRSQVTTEQIQRPERLSRQRLLLAGAWRRLCAVVGARKLHKAMMLACGMRGKLHGGEVF